MSMAVKTKPAYLNQYEEYFDRLIRLHKYDEEGYRGKGPKKKLIKLGKAPIDEDWPTVETEINEIFTWMQEGKNVGIRLGGGLAVLDVDIRNGGEDGLRTLEKELKMDFRQYAKVMTGRGDGSMHIYVRIPEGFKGRTKTPRLGNGIEFKHHHRQQVLTAGSVHPETGNPYVWDRKVPLAVTGSLPNKILNLFKVSEPSKSVQNQADESFGSIGPKAIKKALKHVDPRDFRDQEEWLTLMMSVHWLSGGMARDEFVDWSISDPRYTGDDELICYRWDSLSDSSQFEKTMVKGGFLYKVLADRDLMNFAPKTSASYDFDKFDPAECIRIIDDTQEGEEETTELKTMNFMNSKHALVNLQGRVFIMDKFLHNNHLNIESTKVRFSSTKDMREIYRNSKINIEVPTSNGTKLAQENFFDFWMQHPQRKSYSHVEFNPSKPKEFKNSMGDLTYNLWDGFAFPTNIRGDGDWSLLKMVIKEGICSGDKKLYEYVLNWIAFSYQNPSRPQRVALVLKGQRGVGKGTLARAWLLPWGGHGFATETGEDLFGQYNASVQSTCGLFLDEAFWGGDKTIRGKLQARITEPTIRIEEKHQPRQTVNNFLKILMASNEDFVVPTATDERRFMVIDVDSKFQRDHEFWVKLNKQLEEGGNQAFFYDMINRNIGDFCPENSRFKTDALRHQVRMTFGEISDWFIDFIQNMDSSKYIGDLNNRFHVSLKLMKDDFTAFMGGRKGEWIYGFDRKFELLIGKMLPEGSLSKSVTQVDHEQTQYRFEHYTNEANELICVSMPGIKKVREYLKELFGNDIFTITKSQSIKDVEALHIRKKELIILAGHYTLEGDEENSEKYISELQAVTKELRKLEKNI